MRAALPETVPLADAVANLGAVALGVAGLATGRYDLLARLTVDRLHEPYRAAVYPQLAADGRGGPRAPVRSAPACRAPGSTILAFADSMAGITRIEAAFFAAAADVDLPGQVLVVEPAQHRRHVSRTRLTAVAALLWAACLDHLGLMDGFVRSDRETGSPGSSAGAFDVIRGRRARRAGRRGRSGAARSGSSPSRVVRHRRDRRLGPSPSGKRRATRRPDASLTRA